MRNALNEAFGFRRGQRVRMLVDTIGATADDIELTYPFGAEAVIDSIERFSNDQGIVFTVVIGRLPDSTIVNSFDELDGHPSRFFEAIMD